MFDSQGPSFFELVRQALSSTRDGYDLLAPKFDYTPYRTPDELVEKLADNFNASANTAIDFCCGTGAGIQALIKQEQLSRIVGVDFSQGMLAKAEARFGKDERLELVKEDVLEMRLDGGFDLAICLGALGHFKEEDYGHFLAQVFALLNPGGQYLFLAGPQPKPSSSLFWFCKLFNGSLWIRNLLIKPEFIMYYHKFMFVSEPLFDLLKQTGFTVDVISIESSGMSDGLVQPGFQVVAATKPY